MKQRTCLVVGVIAIVLALAGGAAAIDTTDTRMLGQPAISAANLAFVTFARMHGDLTGQVVAFFVMVVAAAEVVVGLAIIVSIFRTRRSASVDDVNLLKS